MMMTMRRRRSSLWVPIHFFLGMPTLLRVFMSVPAHVVPRTLSLVVEITVIAG
jgi:hypothetical protein